jgi:hypothetical protein
MHKRDVLETELQRPTATICRIAFSAFLIEAKKGSETMVLNVLLNVFCMFILRVVTCRHYHRD